LVIRDPKHCKYKVKFSTKCLFAALWNGGGGGGVQPSSLSAAATSPIDEAKADCLPTASDPLEL